MKAFCFLENITSITKEVIIADIIPHKQFKIIEESKIVKDIIPIPIIVVSIDKEQIETFNPKILLIKKAKTSTPPVDPFPKKVKEIPNPTEIPPHIPHNKRYPISTSLVGSLISSPEIVFAKESKTSTRVNNDKFT